MQDQAEKPGTKDGHRSSSTPASGGVISATAKKIKQASGPGTLSGEERYGQLVEKLAGNKFRFLLERYVDQELGCANPAKLKALITEALEKNLSGYDKKKFEAACKFIEDFYDGWLRKDGKTPEVAHTYTVTLGAILLGCDFETLLASLFHDVLEDSHKSKSKYRVRMSEMHIRRIAGERILRNVRTLSRRFNTKGVKEEYPLFLERIYKSQNLQLMIVKAVDTIEKLKMIYFDANPQLRLNNMAKALEHVDIWRKINKPFFQLMLAIITDNRTPEFEAKIKLLEHASLRQYFREQKRHVEINWRGELDLSLLRSLPDSGSPVLIIYVPESLQKLDYLEVEFPDFAGSADYVFNKIKQKLPWMDFTPAKSKLPEPLQCTTIFKAKMPLSNDYIRFAEGIRALSQDLAGFYSKLQPFLTELENG